MNQKTQQEGFIKKLVDLKIEDKEENFSFMGKENHNIIKKWLK